MTSLVMWARRARLDREAPGEPPHLLGLVRGLVERLGQQAHGGDRGLQLVADVRDEVAAHLVEAVRLGAVLGEQQDEAGAQACHEHPEPDRALAVRAAGDVDLVGDRLAAAAHDGHQVEELGVGERLLAHEAEGERAGRRLQHVVGRVEHDAGGFEHLEHLVDAVGNARRDHLRGARTTALGHVQHDHEGGTEEDAEGQCGEHHPHGVHGFTLTSGFGRSVRCVPVRR